MRLVKVEDLQAGDILDQDVLSDDYIVLLGKGTKLNEEYIDKIQTLFPTLSIYIKENNELETKTILKKEVQEKVRANVRKVLERHTYHNNEQLKELANAAENIIMDVLEKKEVVEQIYDIKERSADLYEHSISVCSLATMTGIKIGVSQKEIYDIAVSSLLHDLGLRYIIVPYENQDVKFLKKKEYDEYKKHPLYGYTAIKDEKWMSQSVKEIILQHHEKIDGSGYPFRKKELSISNQIVSMCDEFDEMICGIGMKRIHVHLAISYLRNYSGVWYDDKLVSTLLHFTAPYPVETKVKLSNGEIGIVVKQNANIPEKPVIKIIMDENGVSLQEYKEINLLQEIKINIAEVLN